MAKSRLMEELYETAQGLHKVGIIDDQTMRDFDVEMLPEVKEYTPTQIIKIRKKNKASQAVFAAHLNTSPSTVQKWEQGQKRPSKQALKLLSLVDRHGLSLMAA